MLNFSVNTNVGAFVALQNLSQTNRSLEVTQTRINTGLKVSSTKDDSGTYAIAQSLRADLGGLNAVKTSLDRAQSTLDVAVAAAESMTDILVQMKEKATAAADIGLDQASRDALKDDFYKLSVQLATYLNNAEFNGSNILKSGGADLSAIVNHKQNADDNRFQTITVENLKLDDEDEGALKAFIELDPDDEKPIGKELVWDNSKVDGVNDPWSAEASAALAAQSVNDVDEAIKAMKTVLSELGSAYRQIEAQQTFTSKLADTVETGIGNLVDADLAKESANLTALQTKQQLGLQALSIANQAPQSILSLFK